MNKQRCAIPGSFIIARARLIPLYIFWEAATKRVLRCPKKRTVHYYISPLALQVSTTQRYQNALYRTMLPSFCRDSVNVS